MTRRAKILPTNDPLFFSAQLEISVSAGAIFDFIARPANHWLMDGSAMVNGVLSGPDRLYLGARFGMKMRQGVPYVIENEVIEFEEGRVIAWHHLLKNVWRYELEPIGPDRTLVTESWDGRNARAKSWLRFRKVEKWAPIAMAKTLVRLEKILLESN